MNKTVSIVVPVYNAERFIKQTIDCVRNQTYSDWELLLIEDSSTDNTLQIMTEYVEALDDHRIRIDRQSGAYGAAGARNRGIELATGRYISYLDADDRWVPEKLEKELNYMVQKDAAFVFSGYEFADADCVGTGKVVRVPETITYKQALANTTIFTSTVLMDTEKIEKELMYMPYIKSEDTASWWKILKTGIIGYGLDENLVLYRRSAGTLSSNKFAAIKRIWNLYRKAENLSVIRSAYNFVLWAFRAVKRRV